MLQDDLGADEKVSESENSDAVEAIIDDEPDEGTEGET